METEGRLVEYVCRTTFSDVSRAAMEVMRHQVLAVLGTTIAGGSAEGLRDGSRDGERVGRFEGGVDPYPRRQGAGGEGSLRKRRNGEGPRLLRCPCSGRPHRLGHDTRGAVRFGGAGRRV